MTGMCSLVIIDTFVKSPENEYFVIPVKTGIQPFRKFSHSGYPLSRV
jgi:hypothetical protein